MPNQLNFRSDITRNTDPRFTASRIVRNPSEAILLEEIPASFGYDLEDVIEVHFYTSISNELVLSSTIKLSDDNIVSRVVKFNDGTYKNYIRIDFTKLFLDNDLILPQNDYKMVLNFFSDEIGSYNNRKLDLDVISDSRTEVQLVFADTIDEVSQQQNISLAKEFVEPSFTKIDALGLIQKIFKSGIDLNNKNEGVTVDSAIDNISVVPNQTIENTITLVRLFNLENQFNGEVNKFIYEMFDFVSSEIVINGDERIQATDLANVIRTIIKQKMPGLQNKLNNKIIIS
jgi:hypothetical protein